MKITTSLFCISLAAATISGCASQTKLTQEQILIQYQQVGSLQSALQQAKTKDADLLAPTSYTKASNSLDRAMTAARNDNAEAVIIAATEGLKTIDKLNRDAQNSRETLTEVLLVRDRAYAAGAKTMQGTKIASLDEDLKTTATLIEKGDIEEAKQRRPDLLEGYSKLELTALKQGTVDQAKSTIASAKKQGAETYAPKILAQAEEEMKLAMSILDADRTQTEKADVYAKKTKWLAEQSAAITETLKDFERRDYTMEDVLLWHQQQLRSIGQPLGGQLAFNEPSEKVVLDLKNAVTNIVNERSKESDQRQQAEQRSTIQIEVAEEKIASLLSASQEEMKKLRAQYESQVAMTEKDRQTIQQDDRAKKIRFEKVQAMFDAREANVYRQRQNVLISAHGFQFPPGQSEIQADNFPLTNKIIQAIKTFPGARIEVVGHTDSTGDEITNRALSESRAQKVAKFLKEVGGIAPEQVVSLGFGEARPVASNETKDGRAENRRVEIKIVND